MGYSAPVIKSLKALGRLIAFQVLSAPTSRPDPVLLSLTQKPEGAWGQRVVTTQNEAGGWEECRGRETWSGSPLTSCVTLGKSLYLSGPKFMDIRKIGM